MAKRKRRTDRFTDGLTGRVVGRFDHPAINRVRETYERERAARARDLAAAEEAERMMREDATRSA